MSQSNSHRPLPPPPASYALARDAFGREIAPPAQQQEPEDPLGDSAGSAGKPKKETATDALGRRAGALSDELDFPAFVSSLVHGTFDAMVDSSIRQMQSFADLVAAVAKPLEQFTEENVTINQARDYLVEQHPRDVMLVGQGGEFTLAPVPKGEDSEAPGWLSDYGREGAELTAEFLEQEVLPAAREKLAKARLQTLSTMVLLGMNRIVIKDGSIGARLRFRAAASDKAAVQYATGSDPGSAGEQWGARGSAPAASTKVSTVGVNVQSDSELKAELFGEVKINFASETLPLDRFLDDAQRTLLERHSRKLPTPPRAVPSAAPAANVVALPPPEPGKP
ncbi:MAG: hypothetical protein V4631_15255 [Pseudomonadota bacterium]